MQTDSSMGREKTFNIRFSEEEWARLDFLARHYGLSAASLIRMLLKQQEENVQGVRPVSHLLFKDGKSVGAYGFAPDDVPVIEPDAKGNASLPTRGTVAVHVDPKKTKALAEKTAKRSSKK